MTSEKAADRKEWIDRQQKYRINGFRNAIELFEAFFNFEWISESALLWLVLDAALEMLDEAEFKQLGIDHSAYDFHEA